MIKVLSLGKSRTTYKIWTETGLRLLLDCDHQSSGNILDIVADKKISPQGPFSSSSVAFDHSKLPIKSRDVMEMNNDSI